MTRSGNSNSSNAELKRLQIIRDARVLQLSRKPDALPLFGLEPQFRRGTEQANAFRRVVEWLEGKWALDREGIEVKKAVDQRCKEAQPSRREVKREALRVGLWAALGKAEKQQETQIGDSSLRRLGDRIVVFQKQDLEALDQLTAGKIEELPPDVVERLRKPAVGERTRLLSAERGPIEGALLGDYSNKVRPVALHPEKFLHWLRRHAIVEAKDSLLSSTNTSREAIQHDFERAERAEEQGNWASETDEAALKRVQKAVKAFEDIRETNRGNPDWVDPEEAALLRVATDRLLEAVTECQGRQLSRLLELLERRTLSEAKKKVAAEDENKVGAIDTAFSRIRSDQKDPL